MEFVLMWIAFGCAAASLAKGKNFNVPLWVVLGLLLGPFALLIMALRKPGEGPDQGYQ
ncbi:hypothetical protein EDC39_102177 [Geothermobacter ehrlichii]|uniref:Uncharacterized protein n=1 Tax=Geothermobacter ehrlichii TaxID=213224 RepID=A0A5D3WLQ8_9BACT|nr:hypothetical protein [Geothermobacter ehrlichii]TYO99652.1 hypothetical protein EDC39_102177 [Geothermobacter ehrlichii]